VCYERTYTLSNFVAVYKMITKFSTKVRKVCRKYTAIGYTYLKLVDLKKLTGSLYHGGVGGWVSDFR